MNTSEFESGLGSLCKRRLNTGLKVNTLQQATALAQSSGLNDGRKVALKTTAEGRSVQFRIIASFFLLLWDCLSCHLSPNVAMFLVNTCVQNQGMNLLNILSRGNNTKLAGTCDQGHSYFVEIDLGPVAL